jgi:DNA-binding transcriptional MerR regulator
MNVTLDELAQCVNLWCGNHQITPANGQAAAEMTVRTLRYYRTVNLLDAPISGGGDGYVNRHYLQACAVRALQAQGLPISRIQSLLFARSDEELQEFMNTAEAGSAALPEAPALPPPETWHTAPITESLMLVSRGAPLQLTSAQAAAIKQILGL